MTKTFQEHPEIATLETRNFWDVDQSDEETWPDPKQVNNKDKYNDKETDNDKDI